MGCRGVNTAAAAQYFRRAVHVGCKHVDRKIRGSVKQQFRICKFNEPSATSKAAFRLGWKIRNNTRKMVVADTNNPSRRKKKADTAFRSGVLDGDQPWMAKGFAIYLDEHLPAYPFKVEFSSEVVDKYFPGYLNELRSYMRLSLANAPNPHWLH